MPQLTDSIESFRRIQQRLRRGPAIVMDDLEAFWAALLSEDAGQIRRAWDELTASEGQAVIAHLQKMAANEAYSDAQRQAAEIALKTIAELK